MSVLGQEDKPICVVGKINQFM